MISIILPAFNEEKNIELAVEKVLRFLQSIQENFEIIIVNDGSTDKTGEVLRISQKKYNSRHFLKSGAEYRDIVIVTHPKNLGYGAALRSGFAKANGDLIFFTDSDLQFDISELSVFLEKIKDYDFVVGYRKNRQDPEHRILFASVFGFITRLFFGVKARDIDCAFKLFKKEVLQSLPLSSSGALINLEIFSLAKKRNYNFIELPVKHFPCPAGEQTGGSLKVISKAIYGFFPLWWKLKKKRTSKIKKSQKNQLFPKNVLALAFVAIFATFFISFIGFTMSKNIFPSLLEIWNRWDTRHYIEIAENGYQNFGKNRFNIAFLPLYPVLIKIFTLIFHNYVLSALIVANIAYIAASIFLYKLVLKDFSEKIALRTVFYFTIFPAAYFLHAGYSDSLLLFLSIASLYYAREEKWIWAGSLGLLASLTKITGVLLLPVLLIEYLFQKKFRFKDIKTNILWLTLVPLGFLYYLFINYQVFGDAFRFLQIMKNHWYKTFAWPWKGFLEAAQGFKWRSPYEYITVAGAEIVSAAFGLLLIILVFRYLRFSYGVYAILGWLITTSTSYWLSIPRYTLWLFPIFIVLALIANKRPVLHYSITIISLLLYSTFLISFVQGHWAW